MGNGRTLLPQAIHGESPHTGRLQSIELLKAIAILGVIVIHTCHPGYSNSIGSWNWTASIFWGSLTRASVPIFLMCSGALLLDPQKELPLKKLFGKNLLRLILALFIWALFYKYYHLLESGLFSPQSALQGLKEVLVFKQEFHLYYLQIMLLVYVCLPVSRLFVRHADQRELQYALGLWFLLGILYPTIQTVWPFSLWTGISVQWMMNMTYASIGYGILGYYLRKYPLTRRSHSFALFLLGFLFVFGGTWYLSVQQSILYERFLEGMSFGVAVMATGIFSFCTSPRPPLQGIRATVISFLSKASFCVYLIHVFWIDCFTLVGLTVSLFPCVLSIPFLALVNLLCSCAVYLVLSRVPFVRKWLI